MTLENAIIVEGMQIFDATKNTKESFFDKNFWLGRLMNWVMQDPSFKIDLFRFVDVLPMLLTKEQLTKHVQEYLIKKDRKLPTLINAALRATNFPLTKSMALAAIKKNVVELAERFIAGVDIKNAEKDLVKLLNQGYCFTIDLLGEKTLSYLDADDYQHRYEALIMDLPSLIAKHQKDSIEKNPPNISLKASALSCNLNALDPKTSVHDLKQRALPLLRLAKSRNIFINFDMENYEYHEIVTDLFHDIAADDEFKSWPHLGIVVQAYLKESHRHLEDLIALAKARKSPITVRLVKGAYWDYEVVSSQKLSQDPPVFLSKEETDQNYEHLSCVMIDNIHHIYPAFGSHNIRSLAHAIAYAKSKNLDPSRYEIQMLNGMAETERRVFLDRGHKVRIYVPLGEMLPGMSYLVRRLLENTSQMSFLKLSHHDDEDPYMLLKRPMPIVKKSEAIPDGQFINSPHADFTDIEVRAKMASAIKIVKNSLPYKVPVVLNGKEFFGETTLTRFCPSDLKLEIAQCSLADLSQAQIAVDYCVDSFRDLQKLPLTTRQNHLFALAEILEQDRYLLAAIMSFEVGKTWSEADADVAEAIDFCAFYAHRANFEIGPQNLSNISGERNILRYQGRGPSVIIAPWNFPLAIITGMSVAAYLAGNPIIIKPSEHSSLTAYMLYERMMKAAFLPNAVQFLPGVGENLGPVLVGHQDVANICFTGSMKVGHEIARLANTVTPHQRQMKKVICEMGGKNAIIIDDDADLDEAISNVLMSAFGYAGQKCSAASRLILVGVIKDQFLPRFIEAVRSIKMGVATDPSTFLGPVVDQEAYDRLKKIIARLQSDLSVQICYQGDFIDDGFFIPPVIVLVKEVDHWLMQEELFGPIIALYHAHDLKHAIHVANSTKYALTGGFFSRSPQNINYAMENFDVGNLYINQKCTGALVQRQPFGGFKMSGTGIKAGGPNYLLNFVDAKVSSENTMRRGFTPEISV